MSGRETSDGHAFADSLQRVADLRRRVEEAEAAPFEISSKPRLFPELRPFDLTATVLNVVIGQLHVVLSDEQKNQVAEAFRLVSPNGMKQEIAEMRGMLAELDAKAESADEQEPANQVA